MSNRKRKHGIFAVSNEAVEMIRAEETKQQKPTGKPIAEALVTVFNQMEVAGNGTATLKWDSIKKVSCNPFSVFYRRLVV